MHYYELEWTYDFKLIFEILTKFYVSMPSILDNQTARLPIIFNKLQEAYENPVNKHKQALWFNRISNPDAEIKDITGEFLPHRHMPGKTGRGVTQKGDAVSQLENGTEIQTTNVQFTIPYINANLGETQWSAIYDEPFLERRRFTEEEITGRYTLNTNPVLFDVMSWHQGRNTTNNEDRVLIGIPTFFDNIQDAVKYIRSIK